MKQLLLQPLDVLFFRDGRPMAGPSPGRAEGEKVLMQRDDYEPLYSPDSLLMERVAP